MQTTFILEVVEYLTLKTVIMDIYDQVEKSSTFGI